MEEAIRLTQSIKNTAIMNSIQFIINRIEKKRFLWGVLIFIIFHMLSVAVEAMPLTPPPDSSQLIIFDATRIRMDLSSVHSGILEDVGITPVDFAPTKSSEWQRKECDAEVSGIHSFVCHCFQGW